jgi:hypothetical protein
MYTPEERIPIILLAALIHLAEGLDLTLLLIEKRKSPQLIYYVYEA